MSDLMERISQARFRLLSNIPFLGYILMKAQFEVVPADHPIKTAAVNAKGHIMFNEQFGGTLTNPQLTFVLVHEIFHPAFGLFSRIGSRNHRLSNIAHDFVINDLITLFEEDRKRNHPSDPPLLAHPDQILWDTKYRDMSFEEVYDLLQKEQKYSTQKYDQFMDAQGSSPGQDDKDGKGSGQGEGEQDGSGMGGMSPAEQDALRKDWEITILEAQQVADRASKDGRGYLPNGIKQMIDEICSPKIDWRTQLSRWMGERGRKVDPTYRRPGRRSDSIGEICPSLIALFPDVAVLWDTSGSMFTEHKKIMAEIADILDNLGKVRIVSCDAAVHADVEASDVMEAMEANIGGGGSDFNPAFDHLINTGYRGPVIAITDGYIGVPEYQPEGLDTLWVLVEKGQNPPAEWGDSINIEEA